MPTKKGHVLSRRQFAHGAVLLSATATLVPARVTTEPLAPGSFASQEAGTAPKLSLLGEAEVTTRYHGILALFGDRLSEEEKTMVRKMCAELQPVVEKIRAFPLENGDPPALFFKPTVEREKRSPAFSMTGGPATTTHKP